MKSIKILLGLYFALSLQSCGDDSTSPPDSVINGGGSTDISTIYNNVVSYQTSYLRTLQITSGAIKDTEESNSRICPYFANFVCLALLKDPSAENVSIVKKYMQWYVSKLNGTKNPISGNAEIQGSIYDYYGVSETTQGTYDSVDSYAATFLMLAMELAKTSGENKTWLMQYVEKLTLVSKAMEKCIDTNYNSVPESFGPDDDDGLSVASYVYPAKYLMDNCEVNQGLKAAKWLKDNNLISTNSGDFQALLNINTSGIESQLWRNGSYNWNDNGSASAITKWTVFYPDATSQLYPGLFDVIDASGDRANRLYTQFNRSYPDWSKGYAYTTYPWTLVCYAAANINDQTRVNEYIKHINSYNVKNTQKAYWYNAEAAFVILAIDKIKNIGNTPPYIPIN